jgi:hypothetical protein
MTPQQREALTAYVTTLQDALGLQAWEILISDEEPVDSNAIEAAMIDAQTTLADVGRYAVMRFHRDFFEAIPDPVSLAEAQRQTVTHELMHLPTDWTISDLLDDVKALGTTREFALIEHRAGQSYERMVDAIAQMIAPLLPLPTWDADALRSDAESGDPADTQQENDDGREESGTGKRARAVRRGS